MNLSNLKPAAGSVRTNKRLGRGQGSGYAGTASRGHKGAQSRAGYKQKRGHEGGQMPLQRRVPKFGFKNISRIEYHGINLDTLQTLHEQFKVSKIDHATLMEHGLASKRQLVKILGRGELKTKLTVKAHSFSATAKAAIEAQGGSVEIINRHPASEPNVKKN